MWMRQVYNIFKGLIIIRTRELRKNGGRKKLLLVLDRVTNLFPFADENTEPVDLKYQMLKENFDEQPCLKILKTLSIPEKKAKFLSCQNWQPCFWRCDADTRLHGASFSFPLFSKTG